MTRSVTRKHRAWAGVLAIATTAWGGCVDAPTPATLEVADSAGIEVVTNLAGSVDAAERRALSAEPVVEIGSGADPEAPLYRITAVRPLADGRVLVGTNSPPRALVFRSDGTLEATLGGEGEGPGEFGSVASVVPVAADSIAVWDADRRRISVFGADGSFARDVDLSDRVPHSPRAAPSMEVPAAFTRLLPSTPGSLVVFAVGAWGPGVPEQGRHRELVTSHLIDATGAELASFGPFPGMEIYVSRQAGPLPFPFGADTHGAASGGSLVVGTAASPELRVYGPDGELGRIVRWPDRDRTLSGSPHVSEFTTWLGGQLEARAPAEAAMLRELIATIPRPELLPAYEGIVSGEDGEIWVGAYPGRLGLLGITPEVRRVPARRWLVFGPDGALGATVETPLGFEPRAVRGDRVWGVYRDEAHVESVRAYAVSNG